GRGYDTEKLMAGGLQMGACYYYAWELLESFRWADMLMSPYGPFLEFPTPIGEFCTGASIPLGRAPPMQDGQGPGQPAANLCSGKQCGDDGCGGSCGTCANGVTCTNGQCGGPTCTPSCGTKVCGDDGCGGSCGTCGAGTTCQSGACMTGTSTVDG